MLKEFTEQNEKIWSRQIHPNAITTSDFEHAMYGLCSEIGELADVAKKLKFMGRTDRNRQTVIDECGDVLFYLERMLGVVGSSIREAVQANIAKLAVRYGQNGELKFKNLKPNKEAEDLAQQMVLGV